MSKRFEDTNKYKKPFIRGLQGAYKVLWDYICLDCDHAGIWQVDFEVAQIYVGKDLPINEQKAIEYFNKGEERIVVLDNGKKWFIRPFVDFQYGKLNPENRAHNSIIAILMKHKLAVEHKPLTSPLEGAMDKDKDMDKDIKGGVWGKSHKVFVKPSPEEVEVYAKSIDFKLDGSYFIDYYESRGWVSGKSTIKDWKAAVRTWKRNDKNKQEDFNPDKYCRGATHEEAMELLK